MDIKIIIGAVVFIILISLQYTLNLILKELRLIKEIMIKKYREEFNRERSE